MMSVLAGILALAVWLLLVPAGAAGRRLRRILPGPSARAGQDRAFQGQRGRWRHGFRPWQRKDSSGTEVALAVIVQQLAALLKGGRSAARLWDELWLVYGGDRSPAERPVPAVGRNPGPPRATLGEASREILAAARSAARTGAPVAEAIRKAAAGDDRKAARRAPDRREREIWVQLAACFDVAGASGCPLAEVLARFAAHLEAESDAEAARQTALAGPRATVRILTWLPFVGLGLGLLLGIDPFALLLGTPSGVAVLVAGLALTAAGRIWSARLVRAAAGPQW